MPTNTVYVDHNLLCEKYYQTSITNDVEYNNTIKNL